MIVPVVEFILAAPDATIVKVPPVTPVIAHVPPVHVGVVVNVETSVNVVVTVFVVLDEQVPAVV